MERKRLCNLEEPTSVEHAKEQSPNPAQARASVELVVEQDFRQ